MSTTRKVRTTASGLVIRSLPMVADNTDTGKRLGPGQVATVYGSSLDASWLYVVAPAGSGWASAAHLVDAPAAKPNWRVAKALDQLLAQINAAAPKRSKAYDGSIGDDAHAARTSDHNPNSNGIVLARDITHDPGDGCDCAKLVAALVEGRDPRISYIIFNGRIWRGYTKAPKGALPQRTIPAWEPVTYTGTNPHDKHMHVSVVADPKLYDDTREWSIG